MKTTLIAVVFATLGAFLMGIALMANARNRATKLRLSAELAVAQRDVAINSRRSTRTEVAAPPRTAHRIRPANPNTRAA